MKISIFRISVLFFGGIVKKLVFFVVRDSLLEISQSEILTYSVFIFCYHVEANTVKFDQLIIVQLRLKIRGVVLGGSGGLSRPPYYC